MVHKGPSYIQTYIHTYVHTYIHTYIHVPRDGAIEARGSEEARPKFRGKKGQRTTNTCEGIE